MAEELFNYDALYFNLAPGCQEDVLVAAGQNLARGSVLGRVIQTTPTTGTADGGNTGDGTVSAVTGGDKTKPGTYTIECIRAVTNGGEFIVTDPDGKFVGSCLIEAGAGGTVDFKSDELNFTVTDGSTDFAVGDKFTVAVAGGTPATGTADGGNTGNGTMTGVVAGREAKVGTYTVKCTAIATNAGTFSVEDPDGNMLPDAEVGTAYENEQINFLLNDGSTDFAVDDEFTIAVSLGERQVKLVNSANTDGSGKARFVLLDDVDATAAAKKGCAARAGSFNENKLIFGGTDTINDHRDALRELGIFTNAAERNVEPQ